MQRSSSQHSHRLQVLHIGWSNADAEFDWARNGNGAAFTDDDEDDVKTFCNIIVNSIEVNSGDGLQQAVFPYKCESQLTRCKPIEPRQDNNTTACSLLHRNIAAYW
jgi:hypothetical protein